MNARTMMKTISNVRGSCVWTVSGSLSLKVNDQDRRAVRLLQWLEEQMPDATVGEAEDVLHAAIWWHTFFASMTDTPENEAERGRRLAQTDGLTAREGGR